MPAICLYYKVHQPYRLNRYHFNDIDVHHSYEDCESDEEMINTISDKSYLPANEIILQLIDRYKGQFKVSFSISGTTLELLNRYRRDVIRSFKKLVATGCVELLAETYYHSLSFLHSPKEFRRQVLKHKSLLRNLFGIEPTVFRNTELVYNNSLADAASILGINGILCDGVEGILNGRSANKIYTANTDSEIQILLRSSSLSDDIAFRFDDPSWSEYPLTADKFAEWLHSHPPDTEVINLFFDYETFGVHKKPESGIFEFLKTLPDAVLKNTSFRFELPWEVLQHSTHPEIYDAPQTISWNDKTGQACLWCENVRQNNTLKKIYSLEKIVMSSGSAEAIDMWGRLQSADYFYYMTHERNKQLHHQYLNPFQSSEEAFEIYKNIVMDFEITLIKKLLLSKKRHQLQEMTSVI